MPVLAMPRLMSSLRHLARSEIFVIVVSKDLLVTAVQQTRRREVKTVQNIFTSYYFDAGAQYDSEISYHCNGSVEQQCGDTWMGAITAHCMPFFTKS